MAVIDKISVKNTSYDIGADSDNVVYDSNNSVKDKIDEYEAIIPSSASSSNKLATANDIPSLTNYIEKSQTTGLLKNDGTVDTNTYLTSVPTATSSALGLVKPDGTTITVDANGTISASADTSNCIQKSATEGLLKNDGTVDTSKHVHLQSTGKILTGELEAKIWNGYNSIGGSNIWTDGDNIYHSNNARQYVLDKSTSTWSAKTWTGLSSFSGSNIWTDGENIYYSDDINHYVLDKSTSTWNTKTWNGLTSFNGSFIWTDGDNIYHSNNASQYVLDKSTSTWSTKSWNGYTDITGNYVWTDGDNIYLSYYNPWSGGSTQYVFISETVYADGFVKSDGTIDTNTYLTSVPTATSSALGLVKPDNSTITVDGNGVISSSATGGTDLAKTRYTITATNWSNSIDANGYYTYTITLDPELSLSWPPSTDIAGVNDSTFSKDIEKEAYDLLDECNLTTTSTLILYAKIKPETTFYIWVEGEVTS